MHILISNESKLPIYEQLKEQIKDAIFGGELTEGEPLPSIRALARDLKISVITTMRAYGDLEAEGLVVNVQGKGCFVKAVSSEIARERKLAEMEDNLQKAIDISRVLGLSLSEVTEALISLYGEDCNEK